ncbi:hypothetical protein EON62_00170 [archaeon]|nr:MAG: hypothetical protein EON62_00170 [archaeon]
MSIISTVAGGIGDGGSATAAKLSGPEGVAVVANGSSGNVEIYIADTTANRIRRVGEAGIINTVAGTGLPEFSGDGGTALSATLFNPSAVAAVVNASSGGVSLYIADKNNNRIRRVDEAGIITTVAGNGLTGYGGDQGPAVNATLFFPADVAVVVAPNSGGVVLYIADATNHVVRRVGTDGIINTVAGTGTPGFGGDGAEAADAKLSSPSGVAALYNATSGDVTLYIADTENHRVRHVDEAGRITTVAGSGSQGSGGDGGSALSAAFNKPHRVAVSPRTNGESGNVVALYISDMSNGRVRRVIEDGNISTMAGSGAFGFGGDGGFAILAHLGNPYGLALLPNATSGGVVVYIADTSNNRIRCVSEGGNITSVAGSGTSFFIGDGGTATTAFLNNPRHVAALYNASSNNTMLYIADSSNNRVRHVNEAGVISTVAGGATASFSGDGGPATIATLNLPYAVAAVLNPTNARVVLYIADSNNDRVRRVDEAGIIATVAGNGSDGFGGDGGPATSAMLHNPKDVAALVNASNGGVVVYIAEWNNHRIRCVNEAGVITTVAGNGDAGFGGDGGPATAAMLRYPVGMALVTNASSGRVTLYFADQNSFRIRRVDEAGNITTVAGTGTSGFSGDGGPATAAKFGNPYGIVAVRDESSGCAVLYVSDSVNHRIRRVEVGGNISTVAGTGNARFGGDDGDAVGASFSIPSGMAAVRDTSGDVHVMALYIADSGNHRVRRIMMPLPSPTPSPSATGSMSPSASTSSSPSPSSSRTASASSTPSASSTGSASGSPSASSTRSASVTTSSSPSTTASSSPSHSGSASASRSASVAASASWSATASSSCTSSRSPTPSSSVSAAATQTSTATASSSPSSSRTGSPSSSPSSSRSNTPTESLSTSPSSSASASPVAAVGTVGGPDSSFVVSLFLLV